MPEPPVPPTSEPPTQRERGDRRDFLQKAVCVTLGGAATLAPVAAGVTVLVSPLFRDEETGVGFVKLTPLEALPVGGPPQLFKVVAEREDAWTRHPLTAIGSVYVQRVGEGLAPEDFRAFSSTCPHLGCAVEYQNAEDRFYCPCHESSFALDGDILSPGSPSPRGLDALEVKVEGEDLWVEFKRFKANVKEKIPVA